MENATAENIVPETGISDDELMELEALAAAGHARPRLPWESYIRCLLLTAIVFLVGVMTWQPSALRFSLIMSMGTPSPGTSLAWKPEPVAEPPVPERKQVQAPAEWRLGPVTDADRANSRPLAKAVDPTGGRTVAAPWRRFSHNPWRWQDDAGDIARRHVGQTAALPPQKPESPFRAGNIAAWPEQPATPFQPFPDLATTPFVPFAGAEQAPGGGLSLPALPNPVAAIPTPTPTQSPPPIGLDTSSALRPLDGEPARVAPPSPSPSTPAPTPEPEEIDWRAREITGPIANAYLTIYPKLKFVGLCVPGQGYIRKYNQVGVPADLGNPKESAQDGRTPYGKYYIADRHRDADGPRLFLSWPSVEDARRIGLDAGAVAQIESAWQRKDLPPQDTAAGGGVGLNGLRNWVEVTEGGFTLEAPHMEEIFTALPDGAWVFVQP